MKKSISFALAALLLASGSSGADVYEVPLFLSADYPASRSFFRIRGAYPKTMGSQIMQILFSLLRQ